MNPPHTEEYMTDRRRNPNHETYIYVMNGDDKHRLTPHKDIEWQKNRLC